MPTTRQATLLRPTVSLSGPWDFLPRDDGEPPAPSPAWVAVDVPHQWHPAGLTPEGHVAWYRRRVEVAAGPAGHQAWLVFTGADYEAEVWVDRTRRARHTGYFAEFEVPLGPDVAGWHEVAVRVAAPPDAAPRHQRQFKGALGWHPTRPGGLHVGQGVEVSTGGLWGDVRLEWRPPQYIRAVEATTRFTDKQARMSIAVALAGPPGAGETAVTVTLHAPDGSLAGRAVAIAPAYESTATAVIDLYAYARWWPWDLGAQPLYQLEAHLAGAAGETGDVFARPLGLREVTREGDAFVINGVPIFLRGIHHIPSLFLSTYDAARADADVQLLRDAGVNAVRLHAHVAPACFYDACDRAGLMIWQDFPAYGGYEDVPEVAAEAVRQARSLVALLGHRPSVIAWTGMTDAGECRGGLAPVVAAAIAAADPEGRTVVAHAGLAGRAAVGDRGAIAELPCAIVHAVGAQALPALDTLRALLPEGASWPPAWESWAWHGFDHAQAFWTAGLPETDDPAAFVAASQAYQAAFLRDALDRLRRARFAPVAASFAFLFSEPWAGLGWGVADHGRGLKEGYYALAEAYQPLYPSLRLPTGKHRAGLGLRPDLMLVNDRPEALDDVVVTISIAGADGVECASVASIPLQVAALGLTRVFPDHGDPLPTHPAWRGTYWLEVVVRRNHRPIARAVREIELDAPPEGVSGYRTLG